MNLPEKDATTGNTAASEGYPIRPVDVTAEQQVLGVDHDKRDQEKDRSEEQEERGDAERYGSSGGPGNDTGAEDTGEKEERTTQGQEEEEARKVKIAHRPKLPTKDEVEAHMVTHWPTSDWCEHCVKGEGSAITARA